MYLNIYTHPHYTYSECECLYIIYNNKISTTNDAIMKFLGEDFLMQLCLIPYIRKAFGILCTKWETISQFQEKRERKREEEKSYCYIFLGYMQCNVMFQLFSSNLNLVSLLYQEFVIFRFVAYVCVCVCVPRWRTKFIQQNYVYKTLYHCFWFYSWWCRW